MIDRSTLSNLGLLVPGLLSLAGCSEHTTFMDATAAPHALNCNGATLHGTVTRATRWRTRFVWFSGPTLEELLFDPLYIRVVPGDRVYHPPGSFDSRGVISSAAVILASWPVGGSSDESAEGPLHAFYRQVPPLPGAPDEQVMILLSIDPVVALLVHRKSVLLVPTVGAADILHWGGFDSVRGLESERRRAALGAPVNDLPRMIPCAIELYPVIGIDLIIGPTPDGQAATTMSLDRPYSVEELLREQPWLNRGQD